MALRLLELTLPREDRDGVQAVLEQEGIEAHWDVAAYEQVVSTRCLVQADVVEAVVDVLADRFGDHEGFRVIILPVEASIPRIESPDSDTQRPMFGRVSREELLEDVDDGTRLDGTFIAMAALSAIVAALGLWRDNIPVIIGAMVLAPLLVPNMGLALATTLADRRLALRVMRAGVVGLGVSFLLAVGLGWLLQPDPDGAQLAARTRVGLTDIALALASGIAGALSFTSAVPSALIGVMVALTLLPALAAGAMLLGAGHWEPAINALLLFSINIIALNLSAVATFVAQGVRPDRWYRERDARRATWQAITLWSTLLVVLAAASWWAQTRGLV